MNDELIFTGYRIFTSKKGNNCNVLEFITKPKQSKDKKRVFVSPVSIFVEEKVFNNFIKNTQFLSFVKVSCELSGNNVYYHLI